MSGTDQTRPATHDTSAMTGAQAPGADTASRPQQTGADQREYRRRSVLWPGQLRLASVKMGRHDFTCQIWNLSLGGARLRIDVPLQSGTEVYLSIGNKAEIPSTVVWTEGNRMGVRFRMTSDKVYQLFKDEAAALGLEPSPAIAGEGGTS